MEWNRKRVGERDTRRGWREMEVKTDGDRDGERHRRYMVERGGKRI